VSVKLMTIVWAMDLSHSEKFVLLALADNANDEGDCWPSITTIAKKTSLSERTVQRAIGELETFGHLIAIRRTGRSTVFKLTPGMVSPQTEWHPDTDAPHPRHSVRTAPVTVSPTHVTVAPRIIKESSVESSKEPSAPPADLDLQAWKAWKTYREKIRKPLKPISIPSAQRALAKHGGAQSAVVEQSIANGWTGLFALKTQGREERPYRKAPTVAELEAEERANAA
jgi:Helix-turn-helix domain